MTRQIKFKPCPVLPEFYIVSSDGHVYGDRGQLKEYKDRDGYPHVYLVRGKERYFRAVHKLILSAWFPKPTEKHQVNHKNGKRDDNRLTNLEWLTSKENTIDGWKRGRKVTERHRENGRKRFGGSNNPKAKLNKEQVEQIRFLRTREWPLKELAKKFGISVAQVSAICTNRTWK